MPNNMIYGFKNAICYSLIFIYLMFPLQPVWGNIIKPKDKNIQINQQKNVPVINVIKPNNEGVSHNKFEQFNVGQQGAVFNNSLTNFNSQLAGQISANPNLVEKSAELIISEVVGRRHSLLLGRLEVVGKPANVVIANPNGISCDGCGFINTPAITLTTGKPQLNSSGVLSAIEVQKGNVIIGAKGLNAQGQTYADIISHALVLNGQIKAKNLSLTQGNNRVDFQQGTITSRNSEGQTTGVAIDAKALGGMYADQIRLTSTASGVGVNLSHIETAQKNLILTVDGKITVNGNIQSNNDINISSKELFVNESARFNAKNDITLAIRDLQNNGKVTAGKDLRVFADTVKNTGENALIQAKNNLWIQKNAEGDLTHSIVNTSGAIKTQQGDLIVRAKSLANTRKTNGLYFTAQGSDDSKSIFANDVVGKEFKNPIVLNPIKQGITDDGVLYLMTHNHDVPVYDFRTWENNYFVNSGINDPNKNRVFLERLLHGSVPISSLPIINLGSYKYAHRSIDKAGEISSGKNLYIAANKLINYGSKISSKDNMILTGENIINSSLLVQNQHERYYRFTPNAMRNELTYTSSPAIKNQMIDYSLSNFRLPDELFALRQIDYPVYEPAKIIAGGSFTADFSKNVDFSDTVYPKILLGNGFVNAILNKKDFQKSKAGQRYPSHRYAYFDYYDDEPIIVKGKDKEVIETQHDILTAKNILINGENVRINHGIKSEKDTYIFAKENIDLDKAELNTKNDLVLSADKSIEIRNQSQITANDMLAKSSKGSILISNDYYVKHYDDKGSERKGYVNVKNNLLLQARENAIFLDAVIKPLNKLSISSGENVLFLESHFNAPKIRVKELWDKQAYKKRFDDFFKNRGEIKTEKDLLIQAGSNLYSSGYSFHSNNDITFLNGAKLSIRPRFTAPEFNSFLSDTLSGYFSSANLSELTRVFSRSDMEQLTPSLSAKKNLTLMSAGDLEIIGGKLSSGENLTFSSGKQLTLDAIAYFASDFPTRREYEEKSLVTQIKSQKDLILSSGGDFISRGATLDASKNITVNSDSNIKFESLVEKSRKNNTDKQHQHRSEVNSGGDLTILSNGSTLFQATKLASKGSLDIAAKGGILYAQAMVESSKWEEEREHCNRFLGIKSCFWGSTYETKLVQSATNKVAEFSASKDINLFAKDDITLEATRINAGKNAKITSQTGKVNFKAVKNGHFEQFLSRSNGFFITHRNKGYKEDTWVAPSLHFGSSLTVNAATAVTADVKAKNAQSLENTLNLLGEREGTRWIKTLKHRPDVQWNLVQDAYDHWDYKSQQLNPVASALITIAVAAMTHGAATDFAAWASSGYSGVTASAISGAAYGGMTALSTQAAIALAENQGDLSKTLDALGRSETVKSIIAQMAVSGALSGLDAQMGWGTGTGNEARLPLLNDGNWNNVAQRIAAQSLVSSTVNTAIQGGSFTENLKSALLSNVASQLHAEGAKLIGDNGQILGQSGKMLSHAVVAGVSEEISGGDAKGAVVGALAAELAAISLGDNFIDAKEWKKKADTQAQLVKLFGGFSGAVFTGEPGGVYSAANSAENTFRHNYLAHHQRKLMERELADEPSALKRAAIHIKWGLTSSSQDGAFAAGVVAGVPVELWETITDVAGAITNYKDTLNGLRALLSSETMFSDIAEGEKQDILNRIKLIETEYEKAGASGAFNAGLETGQLVTKVAGYVVAVKGAASVSANSGRYVNGVLNSKNSSPIIDIREIYRIEPDGSRTYMAFGDGIYKQGFPFEDYISTARKLSSAERLPNNFPVFDYFTVNKEAISVKTLDTGASTYQNPNRIRYKLNQYIDKVDNYNEGGSSSFNLESANISSKTIELAVPSTTNIAQWDAINKSILYANSKNIKFNITVVK